MKPQSKLIASLLLASAFAASTALAGAGDSCRTPSLAAFQQGPGRGPVALPRDPEIEKQSSHNLEVAKFYFYKR
ncbi:MAG: hypothetical protein L0220_15850, partial [Acidobacteria bacterium]|nr:hypothetical protein [Acidobacteriota bacterium]